MSNVRNAVAKREQQAKAPAAVSPAMVVRKAIEDQSNAFRAVLPKSVDPDRFSRLVLTAVKATPELMNCFGTEQGKTSVLLAAMQSAAIGLEPNTPTQECWLLPRRNQGTWECQLSIGYRGYMKLARRSGEIKTIRAEVVREGDVFNYAFGAENDLLEHIPGDGTGELTHAYAVVRFKDGGYNFRVLSKAEVELHRAQSDSWKNTNARPYSPWTKWTDAMWRKTAIRSLVPYLDLSSEVAGVVERDDSAFTMDDNEIVSAGSPSDVPNAITSGSAANNPDPGSAADGPAEPPAETPSQEQAS